MRQQANIVVSAASLRLFAVRTQARGFGSATITRITNTSGRGHALYSISADIATIARTTTKTGRSHALVRYILLHSKLDCIQ